MPPQNRKMPLRGSERTSPSQVTDPRSGWPEDVGRQLNGPGGPRTPWVLPKSAWTAGRSQRVRWGRSPSHMPPSSRLSGSTAGTCIGSNRRVEDSAAVPGARLGSKRDCRVLAPVRADLYAGGMMDAYMSLDDLATGSRLTQQARSAEYPRWPTTPRARLLPGPKSRISGALSMISVAAWRDGAVDLQASKLPMVPRGLRMTACDGLQGMR